jgi:outer membrane protein TolC
MPIMSSHPILPLRLPRHGLLLLTGVLLLFALPARPLGAQDALDRPRTPGALAGADDPDGPVVIDLTLERMVDLALNRSYRVRQLNLSIDRTRYRLRAQQARLKSRVDLELTMPAFNATSEPRWNSNLQKEEIVDTRSRLWEGELSVRQPLILFGFPTNGYLSFNNRMYRLGQTRENGSKEVDFYNRYYVRYVQPFFQPNRLKNDLEEAELDLEGAELNFQDDVVEIVGDLSEDYYDLFEDAYNQRINRRLVETLERALTIASELARADSARAIEESQIRVELANAREQVQQAESAFRLRAASLKTRLGLAEADTITLDPVPNLRPVSVDAERAIRYAMERVPRLRQLDISKREREISLEETKGRNSFRMNVSLSYGREMYQPEFDLLWDDPENSYTVNVNAYVPLWDWGERDLRIQASRINLQQTEMRIEEAQTELVSNVRNEVRNVEEYESRTFAMEENLGLAMAISESSLDSYAAGEITVLDLIQTLRRESDTAENFLDTYLGWRRAILNLQELTFHDYEKGLPVLERFGVEGVAEGASG